MRSIGAVISLIPYTDADLPLLIALNAPDLMEHLDGPESDDQIHKRHEKYVSAASSGTTRVFTIRNEAGI